MQHSTYSQKNNQSGEIIIAVMLIMCIPVLMGFYHERKCLREDAIRRYERDLANQTNKVEVVKGSTYESATWVRK